MSGAGRTPRWLGALLERALPRSHGALVRAELDEEYRRHVLPERGPIAARVWYGRQVVGSIAGQFRHRQRIPSPPRAHPLTQLLKDLRFGLRSFAREPGFTFVALATVAIGIAASTLVFSVLYGVLLRPLPYPGAERMVRLWQNWNVSKDVAEQVLAGTTRFEALAAVMPARGTLVVADREPLDLLGLAVTDGYFALTGVEPVVGRQFAPGESEVGAERVVLLSQGLWDRAFGADPEIVGRPVEIGGIRRTVVGVLPRGHRSLNVTAEYWTPMIFDRDDFSDYSGVSQVHLYGRLEPGVSLEQATTDVQRISGRIQSELPDAFGEEWVRASTPRPLHDVLVEDSRAALWTVMGAVAFLLLIACANVANLLLARSTRRQREMAIRLGLGAGPATLMRQMLTESVLLGLIGGAAGVGLGFVALDGLRSLLPSSLPNGATIAFDPVVAAFALGASLFTSLLFGLAPALRAARADVQSQLREATPAASVGRRGARINRFFVAAEVALAVILVMGAGLMLRTLGELARVDPGFDSRDVLSLTVRLPQGERYESTSQKAAYFEAVTERLESLPGVSTAAAITFLPMATGMPAAIYRVAGVEYPEDQPPPNASFQFVYGDYFEAMDLPVLAGRGLGADDREGSAIVGVVNETFVREAFGGDDPVGRKVTMFGGQEFTVAGVVADARQHSPSRPPEPEVFFSYAQVSWWNSLFLVIESDRALPEPEAVREAIWEVDPEIPISNLRTMEEVVATASADSRFLARLLGAFAALALLLGAIGVYGVMSFTVGERRYEFGVRRALGASPGAILRGAVFGSMGPAAAGVVVGTASAFAMSGLLRGMLFEVAPRDPLTFTVVPVTLLLVAVAAAWMPARRASRVDPRVALGTRG